MKKLLFSIALISFLGSCEPDESLESPIIQELSQPFDGAWSYKFLSCECEPIFLNNGDNVWTFNSDIGQLQIENNMSALYPYLDSTGTYELSYTDDSLFFEGFGYKYYLENKNMFLADFPEADGPLIELECLSSLPNNNCDILINGLLERNNDQLAVEIGNLCVDLEPYSSFFDPFGHESNLYSLVNRLNNNCPDITCSISCYACIYTDPPTSEILFEIDSLGTSVERLVDIATSDSEILDYLSIH
ncbi:MAG: hypothetical protein ACI9L7_000660 [Candidatus Azotimanducaceae bacterium]|jgi:hypothetical protein